VEVEYEHVGIEFAHRTQCLRAVLTSSDYAEVAFLLESPLDSVEDERVIVGDDDSDYLTFSRRKSRCRENIHAQPPSRGSAQQGLIR
jgi:hypothetical protein